MSLSQLAPGESAIIRKVHVSGPERRRLLDLGFVAGSSVRTLMSSPFGDPRSYEIRGTQIALRQEIADQIEIEIHKAP